MLARVTKPHKLQAGSQWQGVLPAQVPDTAPSTLLGLVLQRPRQRQRQEEGRGLGGLVILRRPKSLRYLALGAHGQPQGRPLTEEPFRLAQAPKQMTFSHLNAILIAYGCWTAAAPQPRLGQFRQTRREERRTRRLRSSLEAVVWRTLLPRGKNGPDCGKQSYPLICQPRRCCH